MGKRLDLFYKGSTSGMRLAFWGFVIAAIGVALGFLSFEIKDAKILGYFAFGVTVIGIAMGFVAIAWGWVEMIKGMARRKKE